MMRYYVSCLMIVGAILYAEENEEWTVFLGTERELLPAYVAPFEQSSTNFSSAYVTQLRQVFQFDIAHNGMMQLVSEKAAAPFIPLLHGFSGSFDIEAVRKYDIAYLVFAKVEATKLLVKIVQVATGNARTIGPVTLSGVLSSDRRLIHQMADCLQEALFGIKGVSNSRIAYIVKRKAQSGTVLSEVYVVDADGYNAQKLTDTSSLVVTPIWIPGNPSGVINGVTCCAKSAFVVYVSYELGQPKMFSVDLKTHHVSRVSLMRGNQLTPAVSAASDYLAFCSDVMGTADLYVASYQPGVGIIGKPRQIFHAKGSATACPSFSPDGKSIAFVSNKDGSPKVYVMTIPASIATTKDLKPVLISRRVKEATAPSWSRDGKKIAYSGKNGADRQIWVYDVERKTEEQLTSGPGSKESPSFASDSLHIVYHVLFPHSSQLEIISLNQRDPVKISFEKVDTLFPVYEP